MLSVVSHKIGFLCAEFFIFSDTISENHFRQNQKNIWNHDLFFSFKHLFIWFKTCIFNLNQNNFLGTLESSGALEIKAQFFDSNALLNILKRKQGEKITKKTRYHKKILYNFLEMDQFQMLLELT